MINYAPAIILPFTMVAALIGIYFAQGKPFYRHIAATAVVIATIIGLLDAVRNVKDKAYTEEVLRHLARSLPPNTYWKDRVRRMIGDLAGAEGYALVKAYYTRSDFADPEASTILLFRSRDSENTALKGVLVITPSDYTELAALGREHVISRLRAMMLGEWELGPTKDDPSAESFEEHLTQTVVALYTLPNFGKAFKVSTRTPSNTKSIIIQTGEFTLAFDEPILQELSALPPLKRNVRVAQMIAKSQPGLNNYLGVSH
jgi:hypothetical protein